MKAGPAKSCPSCGERYDTDVLFCPRDGTPLASARNPSLVPSDRDPYLGVELPGQIRLEHLIGIGSMGRVYRAFQGGIERDVAVKVLHRELSGNAELTARFHREAKVASRLVHPNVVQVLMTGALPQSGDARTGGELYLVMEHLDGISLLTALVAAGTSGEGQALPLPRALHVALQVCDAVGEAHLQGIVHRDIKPENVMLVRRGDDPDYVKVLDFGIARLDWADRGMATQAGLIFGTAKYISPEGAEGHPVGPPADVYSIATMLYQMLAGRTPFEGDSPVALLVQHTHTPPAELRSVARASYVPEPLAATIMANLSKKPGERAQNARLLARDLITAARQSGLYPEEITQSTLFSPASLGAVKLASKERTRAHELSVDLAAKIGGVTAADGGPSKGSLGHDGGPSKGPPYPSGREEPRNTGFPAPTLPSAAMADAHDHDHEEVDSGELIPDTLKPATAPPPATITTPSPAGSGSARPRSPVRAGAAQIDDALDGSPTSTLPGAPLGAEVQHTTTMQGTETTLDGPSSGPRGGSRRTRTLRVAVLVACSLLAAPVVILGGRRLGGFGGTAAAGDSLEASLDEARETMRRRAWDAPAVHNFKDVTDAALVRWPTSTALADLRREAAERLVADALGRKYANDLPEATHLANLALHFDPQHTTAQHLSAELAGAHAPDVAPASSASAAPDRDRGKGHRGRDARVTDPKATVPVPKAPASGAPAPPPVPGSALLPQVPAPRPTTPQPTGPWL
jgi:serine/threonine-protein kinase